MAESLRAFVAANENDLAQSRVPRRLPEDGGGGHDGGMPPDLPERVAVLETHIGHINQNVEAIRKDVGDIRGIMRDDAKEFRSLLLKSFTITWGGLIFAALGLAGLMAKGFKWF